MKNRMRPGLLPLVMILLIFPFARAAGSPLEPARARDFLNRMLAHPDSLDSFLHPTDLKVARRLGIRYPEAPCKPLISWDLSAIDRERLLQVGLDGQFTVEPLDGGHSRLVLFPLDSLATRSWVFRDGLVVSPILYQVRDWQQIDSPHFRFFVSDTTGFHPANIEALETFLADTAARLGMTDADLERLAAEKIYYCFCSSPEEIRELTGYEARGMYMVSHDIIVSTFSAHFHELAHLLINYKLRQPHLYTHPFFLEGFAVAVGGRGGKAPAVQQQLGLAMYRSGFVTLEDLRRVEGFYGYNASVSYPAAGLYNRFLLEQLDAADYLSLYARYGGDAESIVSLEIAGADLPEVAAWERFLAEESPSGAIEPGGFEVPPGADPLAFLPLEGGSRLGFVVPGTTLVRHGEAAEGYRSFLCEDLLPEVPYAGERYFIRASEGEAAIYDLFTNTMLALHATGFSGDVPEIPVNNGRFCFTVDRSLFPEDMTEAECRYPE